MLERFRGLQEKARTRTGRWYPIIVIQEAGLDGFWINRALVAEGIESHVVDPASIATSRRCRRASVLTALVRALLAYKRGDPRVCAMVRVPTLQELKDAIHRFLNDTNANPRPFTWTKDPNKIIAAVKRGHQVLDSIH
jgi:transposase